MLWLAAAETHAHFLRVSFFAKHQVGGLKVSDVLKKVGQMDGPLPMETVHVCFHGVDARKMYASMTEEPPRKDRATA